MKWILTLAALVALPVQAALIEYTYDITTYRRGLAPGSSETSPGTAMILVDTSSETLKEFSYADGFSDFLWSGSISPTIGFVQFGSAGLSIMAVYATIGVWPYDSYYAFYLEHNARIYEGSGLNYLDSINTESYFEINLEDDEFEYRGRINSAGKRIVSVPEPATLSLLALGLAAIGIRRRLRYS